MMIRSKNQLFLRHFKIVAILVIVVFSDDTLCQKRNPRRRPVNSKTLDYSKLTPSVLHKNNNRNVESKKSWPFNLVKSNNQRKWKSPTSSSSLYTLSKKKGLLKPKISRKISGNTNSRYTRQRPSRGFKTFGGSRKKSPQHIVKKLGHSPLAFGRSKKYRPINRAIGQRKSGSFRSQSYSSLPQSSGGDNGIRRQLSHTDNRAKRKLDVINEWITRIKDSTKHHSMSPSYTTQSRIKPIPISSLPLQNERVDNFPSSKGQKLINQIFQPKSPKQQQKRFNNLKGFLRKAPNRAAKPKKGQKKQGIWPTKLNFGFLNNKKKSKRPFTNKKSAPQRPFSKPSLEPPRVGDIISKVKPKRLSPPEQSTFANFGNPQNQFPPQSPFSNTKNIANNGIRNAAPHSSKNAFSVDPTFSAFDANGASPEAGGFFPQQPEFPARGQSAPNRFSPNGNPSKRNKFQQPGEHNFGSNWRPNGVPIQFTPTEGYDGASNIDNNDHYREDDHKLMGNPLSRYRPMQMEEPMTDIGRFKMPDHSSKVFQNKNNGHKHELPSRNRDTIKNGFPNFPSLGNDDEVMNLERFPTNTPLKRPGLSQKRNPLRKKVDRQPQRLPQSTTPRPIPIPGKDFAFVVPHRVQLPSPQQPALPVSNPISSYDRDYNDYEDTNDYDYDNNNVDTFGNDDEFSESVGFMNAGFGPSWEPSKLSKRRKRDAPEGRSAASSIFWHNGQPIQPRNRNRKNRRRNRQNVWGERNQGEEDDGLEYHIVRGNRNGGYRNGGGAGQAEAADFWDDFNIHDPQSIYADKYSTQEETSGGGNYRQHQYKTPSIESAWGQRQQPINRNQGGRRNKYRDPYPQQSIQDRYQGSGKEHGNGYGNEFYGDPIYVEEKNEVLGSGNFDVVQGGTFYDGEAYYDEYDYNRPGSSQGYDSENNIDNNFRDFADIKNDLVKYDQGYVPRYKKRK